MFPSNGNYTLGRGRLYFDRFLPGTTTGTGQRYFGNTPELSLTSDSESLDHYSSDEGVRQKDDTALLSLSRTGSFTTDHISPSNLALFFLGDESVVSATAIPTGPINITSVKRGRRYQLGASPQNPAGVRNVTGVTITSPANLVAGVDHILDGETGGITFSPTSSIVTDDVAITGTFASGVASYNRVVSSSNSQIDGSLLYVGNNPRGMNFDYFWPKVTLRPDGDFALKSDEWQTLGFSFEALKLNDQTEVVYITGRPGQGI